jgi:hypothetical protein
MLSAANVALEHLPAFCESLVHGLKARSKVSKLVATLYDPLLLVYRSIIVLHNDCIVI